MAILKKSAGGNMMIDKPALVMGNGPSLDKFNPALLDGVDSFGTNAIGSLFSQWGRTLDNIIIFDATRMEAARKLYKDFPGNLYIGHQHYIDPPYEKIKKLIGRDFIPVKQLIWPPNNGYERFIAKFKLNRRLNRYLINRDEMSFDFDYGFMVSSSVVIVAIQLVAALGYKKILLTGVDASYQSKTSYAKGIASTQNPAPRIFTYNFRADLEPLLVKLQIYFEEMGIELIDCTPGGKLRYINKSTLEEEITL